MFYDTFGAIRNNITKKPKLDRPKIHTINPSSQSCYSITTNKQLGTCLRQAWFDKTNQPKTNPINVKAIMASYSGNWWEEWFINQCKEINIYDDDQINASVPSKMVRGFIDISFINPHTTKLELGEIKTYDGSNYLVSQNIVGTAKIKPKPKIGHLLQAFRYLLIYKDEVEAMNLFYIDRSCGEFYKNKQFRITLIEIDKAIYPNIETIWNNEYYSYIENEVTNIGIDIAEDKLIAHLKSGEAPAREYTAEYSPQQASIYFEQGKISDYYYNKYLKDPITNPVGDWNCKYCPYYKGTCETYAE